jgi:Sulfotransferase family
MSVFSAVKQAVSFSAKPPVPNLREQYLFIICMNNSGSTLLERVLKDCRNVVGFLAPGGPDQQVNGQRFVTDLMPTPGKIVVRCRRIWSEQAAILADESRYQWPAIKRRWRQEWERNPKFRTANPRIFLEKSPANVLRAKMLQKHFPNSSFVLMQRNPYAVAEGIRRRTKIALGRCIQHWIRCAQQQIENEQMLESVVRFGYEDLSEHPDHCWREIVSLVPALDDLDLRTEVCVQSIEGKVRRPIVDYNQQQIERLTPNDLQEINRELAHVPDVMQHFGYSYLRSPDTSVHDRRS